MSEARRSLGSTPRKALRGLRSCCGGFINFMSCGAFVPFIMRGLLTAECCNTAYHAGVPPAAHRGSGGPECVSVQPEARLQAPGHRAVVGSLIRSRGRGDVLQQCMRSKRRLARGGHCEFQASSSVGAASLQDKDTCSSPNPLPVNATPSPCLLSPIAGPTGSFCAWRPCRAAIRKGCASW